MSNGDLGTPAHDNDAVVLAQRLAALRNGFEPLPASGKAVLMPDWQTLRLDEATVRLYDPAHANTGIRTGTVVGIDIDVLDPKAVNLIEVEALFICGYSPLRRVGRAPKCLLVYRSDDPARRKMATASFTLSGEKARVELLGFGQQFIAFGTHPETGEAYKWLGPTPEDVPVADFPIVTDDQLREFLVETERVIREAGGVLIGAPGPGATKPREASAEPPPNVESVVALLDAMDHPPEFSRDDWTSVMLAVRGCIVALDAGTEDEARIADAAIAWSAKHHTSEGEDAEREKWDRDWSKRNAHGGWTTLLRHARRLASSYVEALALGEFEPAIAELLPAPRRSSLRDRFLFPADCATGPRRGYLIKHLLAPGDVAALIGPPGAGKSILAPHLAYALAQGRSVFNLRTKPGRILYLAAEDFSGMRQRIHALKLRCGDSPNFAVVDMENLRDPETVKDLRAAVAHWKPSLVVLDTLGAAFAGMDENSPQDMGEVVKLARELAATRAAVLLIHHIAKHGDGSPRGHSVLNGTLDMCLSLAPKGDDGVIRGKLSKNRNGTTDRDIAFRFEAVHLGQDEDGDSITAPRAIELDPGDSATAAGPKLSSGETSALCLLHEMAAGRESVPEDEWRARCDDARAVSRAPKPDSRRRAFDRAYSKLLDAGLVTARSGHVFLTEDGQSTAISAVLNRAGQTSTSRNGSEFGGRDESEHGPGKARTQPGQSKAAHSRGRTSSDKTRTKQIRPRAKPVVARTDTDRSLRSVQSSATDAEGNEIGDSRLYNPTGTVPTVGLGDLLQ